jgi:hypothetical protein
MFVPGEQTCARCACRIWFLIGWKENLVDVVVRMEKRKRVTSSAKIACRTLCTGFHLSGSAELVVLTAHARAGKNTVLQVCAQKTCPDALNRHQGKSWRCLERMLLLGSALGVASHGILSINFELQQHYSALSLACSGARRTWASPAATWSACCCR